MPRIAVAVAAVVAVAASARRSPSAEPPEAALDPLDALDLEYERTVKRLTERREAIKPEDNAATHYWKAFAALAERREGALDDFLDITLVCAAPQAVTEMPGAKEEIARCREAVTVHLRRGASLEECAFDLDWRKGAMMLMPHLAKARNLARRAICYGKLLEYEKKPREAARVYLDVIRMAFHLMQDPSMIQLLVGIACGGMGARAVEGLLARGVDAETARLLLASLRAFPAPTTFASQSIELERVWFGGTVRKIYIEAAGRGKAGLLQVLEGMDAAWRMLGDEAKEHELRDVPDDVEEIKRLIAGAFKTHDDQMKLVGAATRRPYHEAGPRVKRLARMQESYLKGERKKGSIAGALIEVVAPAVSAFHVRLARFEACLRGQSLLAAACLAKAETGEYPADLAALTRHFPKGLPVDPFTGGSFSYWLPDGLPAVACKGDDPKLAEKRPELYHFGLSYRLELEEHGLKEWRKERERRRPAAPHAAPGGEAAGEDEVW